MRKFVLDVINMAWKKDEITLPNMRNNLLREILIERMTDIAVKTRAL